MTSQAWVYIGPDNGVSPVQGFEPIQLETSLQSNVVSHWMGTNLKSALYQQPAVNKG